MIHPERHIFEQTPDSLAEYCAERGWPAFRAKQILEWVYAKRAASPSEMTNLPKLAREQLAKDFTFSSADIIQHQLATDATQKLLMQWRDQPAPNNASINVINPDPSRQTECVMIPSRDTRADGLPARRTACISSQVGCPVGCTFCASGLGGLDANLTAGRIVEQVWQLSRLPDIDRITNVVFMGMGEPLANLKPVIRAVEIINAPWGPAIGARQITISTVGLPKAIDTLADELDLPVTLALSLHAPNDELRRQLIPWAEHATIEQILDACRRWFEKTKREITLEYILLSRINDRPEHARQLADVAKTLRANVNLIRYNEVDPLPFNRPINADVIKFQSILKDRGVNAHIRASRGRDIAAACGQLRHESASRKEA